MKEVLGGLGGFQYETKFQMTLGFGFWNSQVHLVLRVVTRD